MFGCMSRHFVNFKRPQNVHFHYFKVCYWALVEENLMVYITQKRFSAPCYSFSQIHSHMFVLYDIIGASLSESHMIGTTRYLCMYVCTCMWLAVYVCMCVCMCVALRYSRVEHTSTLDSNNSTSVKVSNNMSTPNNDHQSLSTGWEEVNMVWQRYKKRQENWTQKAVEWSRNSGTNKMTSESTLDNSGCII